MPGTSAILYVQTLKGRLEFWKMVEPDNVLVKQSMKYLQSYSNIQH